MVEALGSFRVRIQAEKNFSNDDIVTTLKSIISDLKAGLNTVIAASEGLLEAGVGIINKASQLMTAWTKVATVIEAFVDVLRKNSTADFPSTDSLSALDSSDEISSYELADVHGHDRFTRNNPSHSLVRSDGIEAVAGCAYYTTSDLFSSRLFSMVVGLHLKL